MTRAIEECGFVLSSIRTICSQHTPFPASSAPIDGVAVRTADMSDVGALERIASSAHTDTRFYVDSGFSRESCSRLYQTWIRRSCEGWADAVFTAEWHGQIAGYLSVHRVDMQTARVGLVAVAPEARGMRVGLSLVQAALRWCDAQSVARLSIATQAENVAALRLYQRCGFSMSAVDLWFHKWW